MPQHYRILNLESVLGIPDQSQRILNLKRFWKDSRTVIFLLDKPRSAVWLRNLDLRIMVLIIIITTMINIH